MTIKTAFEFVITVTDGQQNEPHLIDTNFDLDQLESTVTEMHSRQEQNAYFSIHDDDSSIEFSLGEEAMPLERPRAQRLSIVSTQSAGARLTPRRISDASREHDGDDDSVALARERGIRPREAPLAPYTGDSDSDFYDEEYSFSLDDADDEDYFLPLEPVPAPVSTPAKATRKTAIRSRSW